MKILPGAVGSGITRCIHLKFGPAMRLQCSPRSEDFHAEDSKPAAYKSVGIVGIDGHVIDMLVAAQHLLPILAAIV